jgi:SAM-dependent methyltransferase
MDEPRTTQSQAELWNGRGGDAWVETQDVLDRVLQPMGDVLVDAVAELAPRRVLDIGCGSGQTTVAAARRLVDAEVTGIDISEPMIVAARARAEREGVDASFVHADVQRYDFEAGSATVVMSRFGVMFFDDPVLAFSNLRVAASGGGSLRLVVWRTVDENPFMSAAPRAAAPIVPMPSIEPNAPGPFGLADPGYVRSILEGSGWVAIDLDLIDLECTMPEPELVRYFTRIGAVGRVFGDLDVETQNRVLAAVRPAFDPFVDGDEVRFTAACWMVSATAP